MEDNVDADGTNPNEVRFLFQLREDHPLSGMKQQLFTQQGAHRSRAMRLPTVWDFDKTQDVFSWLRYMHVSSPDYLMQLPLPIFKGEKVRAFDCDVEAAALCELERACAELLAEYPTTLEQDIERLLDTTALPPFSNARNAVIHVRGEKEVLHHYIDLAQLCVPLLRGTWQEAKATIAKHIGTGTQTAEYLRLIVGPLLKNKARQY